jgi:hypothetical protein
MAAMNRNSLSEHRLLINVIPAQAGIQNSLKTLDARFRGHDE